jgi:hypothetical protein
MWINCYQAMDPAVPFGGYNETCAQVGFCDSIDGWFDRFPRRKYTPWLTE